MTKLNKAKIKWVVRQVVKLNRRPEDVAPVCGVTSRRVRQFVKSFRTTGKCKLSFTLPSVTLKIASRNSGLLRLLTHNYVTIN